MKKKKLTAKDVAAMLDIPLVKIQRWVHQGKIPCKFKDNAYFFKPNEIEEWARSHNFNICETEKEKKKTQEADLNLYSSIKRAGISYQLEGDDIFSVMQKAVSLIDFPENVDRNLVLDEIIFREGIASTGIGKGVAIPHLKDVQHLKLEHPLIPVFFLENPIDFNSIDGKPVSVLFFLFCPTPEFHLKVLSRLSYCLHNEEFLELLHNRADQQHILAKIDELETKIGKD